MSRAGAVAWLLLAASSARAQELAQAIPIAPPVSAVAPELSAEDEVLLFEVTLDNGTLTDSLQGYSRLDGVLLPIGELGRLLDLNVDVRPRERRVIGRIGSAQSPLLVDLATGTARVDRRNVELPAGQAMASLTDIYLDTRVIEQLLPVRIKVDPEGLLIALTATEQLPIQSKLERLGRLRELSPGVESHDDILWAGTRPGLWSAPAFDLALEGSVEAASPTFRNRYDIRAGADVLYTGFEGYVGSDEQGRPTATRFTFERRDLQGDMLGPIGATRLSIGDVYTPSLAVGPRSVGGRGVSVSSAPLQQASVFDRVDLRGELPIGYDVELYINDVLRGGQQTSRGATSFSTCRWYAASTSSVSSPTGRAASVSRRAGSSMSPVARCPPARRLSSSASFSRRRRSSTCGGPTVLSSGPERGNSAWRPGSRTESPSV